MCPVHPHTDPDAALDRYASAREGLRSIRAEARVDQRGREGRVRGTVLMFVEHPGRVRFDAMTQFGPAAILTSDGERFAYADLRENRYHHGPTCPRNIARLLGMRITARQTSRFLLGFTPVLPGAERRIVCTSDGHYRIFLKSSDGRQQEIDLEVREDDLRAPPERQHLRLLRSEMCDAAGDTLWRVTFEDYRMVPAGRRRFALPFDVRVVQPSTGSDTRIRFKEIDVNPEIPGAAFVQTPPPGMPVEQLSCD
jgi:hypothetical protein